MPPARDLPLYGKSNVWHSITLIWIYRPRWFETTSPMVSTFDRLRLIRFDLWLGVVAVEILRISNQSRPDSPVWTLYFPWLLLLYLKVHRSWEQKLTVHFLTCFCQRSSGWLENQHIQQGIYLGNKTMESLRSHAITTSRVNTPTWLPSAGPAGKRSSLEYRVDFTWRADTANTGVTS